MALEQPFPKNVDSSHKEVFNRFIQQAIQELFMQNVAVTEDTMNNYLPNIAKLLYMSTSHWRGSLKKVAAPIVKSRYNLPLGNDEIPSKRGHNSQDIVNLAVQKVEDLLTDDNYVQDGEDDGGHANNYTHPAFREIIHKFFYEDSHGLARTFSDFFNEKVPDNVLVLVITIVCNCIEEYRHGQFDAINFTAQTQARQYNVIMQGLATIRGNAYHSVKLTNMLKLWAAQGCDLADIPHDEDDSRQPAAATVILD
ncbi:hypothetical protein BT96DRAFT_1006839 [Gymnopus androsaceus JB14]|uniref:DUF6532 domain-containing protein n=1 Tax=Gymnopus androsaceus JB14 TaxID=1447944 RepID=A0A6A4GIY9_9AGAR|nr:hypothetical protein BT96DRAFT_1006839 [Gymnopus androsaceus JB14]